MLNLFIYYYFYQIVKYFIDISLFLKFSALFDSPLDSNSYYYIVNRRDGKMNLPFLHSFWKNAGKRKQAQVTHLIIGSDQYIDIF